MGHIGKNQRQIIIICNLNLWLFIWQKFKFDFLVFYMINNINDNKFGNI